MARLSATAALLLVVISLLTVAHCGALAVAAEHDTEPESTAAVAVSDDNVLSDPTVHAEAGTASATEEEAIPAEQQQHGFELLRLPSHRLHHHHHHHHLWWKRHHGIYRDASHKFPCSGHGARREQAVSHLAILPASAEVAREAREEMPVAEPDPDRSLPDSDGEGEVAITSEQPSPFADADGHDDESAAAVRAWKHEMLRRWFHFHHDMRHHRLHHVQHEEEEEEATTAPETTGSMGMKRHRFHFHHHDDEDEEKNMAARKRLRHAHEHEEDSDDEEDEQVEEMVRRFRKAIMRRRFGHGHGHGRRSRFFHHIHRHAEEAKKQADVEEEESGVLAWIKGLMNRF